MSDDSSRETYRSIARDLAAEQRRIMTQVSASSDRPKWEYVLEFPRLMPSQGDYNEES